MRRTSGPAERTARATASSAGDEPSAFVASTMAPAEYPDCSAPDSTKASWTWHCTCCTSRIGLRKSPGGSRSLTASCVAATSTRAPGRRCSRARPPGGSSCWPSSLARPSISPICRPRPHLRPAPGPRSSTGSPGRQARVSTRDRLDGFELAEFFLIMGRPVQVQRQLAVAEAQITCYAPVGFVATLQPHPRSSRVGALPSLGGLVGVRWSPSVGQRRRALVRGRGCRRCCCRHAGIPGCRRRGSWC